MFILVKSFISTPFIINFFLSSINFSTWLYSRVFPWAFHYGYQMLSTRIHSFFSSIQFYDLSVVQSSIWPIQSWNEPHRSWLLFLRTERWSWIPKTPRKQFLCSFYTAVQNNQRNGLKPNTLTCAPSVLSLLFFSALLETLGPRHIFPSMYILFNVQTKKKIQLLF